ncbi:MAG: tyrosine-protein phosphatase [Archangiaceae bacterium]|nr:tyrosine-protein phosphatase [Archangiaceae bacterium]
MMPTQTCPAGSPVLVNQVRNARDLGGLSATSGATQCGVIFRSAAPGSLDAAGCAELTRLGISTIIDLRESSEWMSLPDGACPGITVVHAPLPIPYSLSTTDYLADLHADASMKLVFETMSGATGGVLFHCTYGRDRSGVVAALLLRALGVSRADVLKDYSRTTENGLGGTPPSLEAVLDELDRTGGARAHLTRIGVSDESWNALATRFVF